MKIRVGLRTIIAIAVAATVTSCQKGGDAGSSQSLSEPAEQKFFKIDAKGELIRPTGYRNWVFVGTPLTPNDMNDGAATFPEFHAVYIDPVSFEYWRETGKFRDGTILMKEMTVVGTKRASSGKGYFMGGFAGLEATIKSKKHFPNEPGNWAYFTFTNPTEGTLAAKIHPHKAASCNACHENEADDDFVFTQYYPVLTASKGVGKGVFAENKAERIATDAPPQASTDGSAPTRKPKWLPKAPTPKVDIGMPLDTDALFAWLKDKKYESFEDKELEMHESDGPHLDYGHPVRVFMNKTAADSMRSENAEHPLGSVIVKELFTPDKSPTGWAVMAKTQATTDGGKGWFWAEWKSATDGKNIQAIGNGVSGCYGCHGDGADMVKTSFPLK